MNSVYFGIEKIKTFTKEKYKCSNNEYSFSNIQQDPEIKYCKELPDSLHNAINRKITNIQEKNVLNEVLPKGKNIPTKNFKYNLLDNNENLQTKEIKFICTPFKVENSKQLKFNHKQELTDGVKTINHLCVIRSPKQDALP